MRRQGSEEDERKGRWIQHLEASDVPDRPSRMTVLNRVSRGAPLLASQVNRFSQRWSIRPGAASIVAAMLLVRQTQKTMRGRPKEALKIGCAAMRVIA